MERTSSSSLIIDHLLLIFTFFDRPAAYNLVILGCALLPSGTNSVRGCMLTYVAKNVNLSRALKMIIILLLYKSCDELA